ncbi:MAG TPA: hypothetical protein VGJ26_01185 [Pirellulales bacterium]
MSGCAAMKASQQPPKRNLNVLSQGTPRTHVIAELGAPIWTDPKSETPIDIYSFKQGYTKGVKATRALAHGAADVATWGLWEVVGIPTETIIDGTDVQLTVYYDEQQQIRTVDVLKGEKAINPPKPFAWARRNPKPKETMPPSESVEQPAPEGTELRIEPPAGKKILAGGADDDVIRR